MICNVASLRGGVTPIMPMILTGIANLVVTGAAGNPSTLRRPG
jgi:hypothetical protein